jgi:hypothetical protein
MGHEQKAPTLVLVTYERLAHVLHLAKVRPSLRCLPVISGPHLALAPQRPGPVYRAKALKASSREVVESPKELISEDGLS